MAKQQVVGFYTKDKTVRPITVSTGKLNQKKVVQKPRAWLLRGKTLLETTVPRDKYFGFVLTDEEAEKFFFDNW